MGVGIEAVKGSTTYFFAQRISDDQEAVVLEERNVRF